MRVKRDGGFLYGRIGLSVYDVKGGKKTLVLRIQKRNQVVGAGRSAVMQLLFQDDSGNMYQQNPDYNKLWVLGIGTGGTPPSVADIGLESSIWTSHLEQSTEIQLDDQSSPTEILISKELPAGAVTGATIQEVGLFTKGDAVAPPGDPLALSDPSTRRLYARQTFTPIDITSTMSIEFDWRLGFTIQV